MPFIDLNTKTSASFIIPSADITIIGAGAAGILLAIKLSKQGKKILIIESGHFKEDEERQQLNQVKQEGKILQNAVWGRKRAVGGTTIAWGGQSLPFTPTDFEKRDWVKNSGWPITYEEILPYYKEANSFMDIDTMNYSTDIFSKIKLKDCQVDSTLFDYHVSKWAVEPNFYLLYKQELETKVTVMYNAQVTGINETGNEIDAITISNFRHTSFMASVKVLIIAAGTIETVRLLLCNKLGNQSGYIGKFFMDHPCMEVGTINTNNPYKLQRLFNTHVWKGRKYSVRLSLAKQFQQQSKLLNCSASIMFQLPEDSFDPYGELKSFRKDFNVRRLVKISGSALSIIKSSWAYIINSFYYKINAIAKISLMIEQEPSEESFISLDKSQDAFGIPKALINWRISYQTWKTAIHTVKALKNQIEDLQLGNVSLYPGIKEDNPNWNDYLTDVCHHMGGSRMSTSAENGVVDQDLKIWGIRNLYVCSCSVFPTVSHSNPTLTLLALASRLANHLKVL